MDLSILNISLVHALNVVLIDLLLIIVPEASTPNGKAIIIDSDNAATAYNTVFTDDIIQIIKNSGLTSISTIDVKNLNNAKPPPVCINSSSLMRIDINVHKNIAINAILRSFFFSINLNEIFIPLYI